MLTATRVIRVCLFMLAGGLAAQHNRVPIGSDLCTLLIVAAVFCLLARRLRLLACAVLGFGLFIAAANSIVDARLNLQIAGDSVLTQVRISDFAKMNGRSVSLLVEPVADSRLPARTRIRWHDPADLPAIGEVWQFELRLRRPRGNSNPGVFDLEEWLFRDSVHATGYVVDGTRNRRLDESVLLGRAAFRQEFVQRALRASDSTETAAVLSAIGVGTRHLIATEQWERYARTGTTHLMAISGLHVGLAASVAFVLLTLLFGGLRLPGNTLAQALVGSVVIAALYAWVSGFAVPARRATSMLVLAALALLYRRRLQPGRIVAFSAMIVYVFDPIAAMSPGFNLSFAAVLVLLWHGHGALRPRPADHWTTGVSTKLGALLRMQGVLLLGLMPLTVIFFQRVALLAPAVNLVVVPIFGFVTVPLALLAMVLLRVSDDWSGLLLQLAAASIDLCEALVRRFSESSLANISPASIQNIPIYVLILTALWVVLPRRWPGRWVAVIAVIAVVLQRPADPPDACVDAHVLDVGHGLVTIVRTMEHTLIFDTGVAYRSGGSAAQQIVLPFLRFHGIHLVDWMIVSHADQDHAGGVDVLHERLSIGRTLAGEAIPESSVATVACEAGQSWQADGVSFRVLHPGSGTIRSGNDASCVVEVSVGEHRLLLTGDIEATAEREILARKVLKKTAVIIVPHHGSSTSSTADFIDAVKPSLAIVSAGYENRWGFPRDDVVARWQDAGARVLNTATAGAISVRLCKKGGLRRLRQHRARQHRFWRDRAVR